MGFDIRHLRVNFRSLKADFGHEKLILALCDLSLGFEREIILKFGVLCLLGMLDKKKCSYIVFLRQGVGRGRQK